MKTVYCTHTDLDGFASLLVVDFFKVEYDKLLICDYGKFDDEKLYEVLTNR